MKTTKAEYIRRHPKAKLTVALRENNWPEDTGIEIVGGKHAPDDKRSNLYKALQRAKKGAYVVGARRQRRSEGLWYAVA